MHVNQRPARLRGLCHALVLGGLVAWTGAQAGMTTDRHGNVGYDTAAECDAAMQAGTARAYQPFTEHPPLRREGEADVKRMTLRELASAEALASQLGFNAADYARGACDRGVGRSQGRDGVSGELVGKFVPYSPDMPVNVYFDAQGRPVRATMQRCDNHFGAALPRPVGRAQAVSTATECFATVLVPARFEPRAEQVVKVAATQRFEVVPATYKTVTEQVLVSPEYKRQIPVPATYKTVTETVVVKPEGFREEPVPATYKDVAEQVLVKPAGVRLEVVPATYKTVTEQVEVAPARKELKVVPATYKEVDEEVEVTPATTRVETVPATYRTETEQVLTKAESVRYEPLVLPLKTVTEELERSEASQRLEVVPATYRTVTERVVVREASEKLEVVPAVYETVTERIQVADATREWKRGRAWIGRALEVKPVRGFAVGADGKVDGSRVDAQWRTLDPNTVDDDVMCLVEIPAQYETVSRQVLKSAETVRKVVVPAEYATVTRQVQERAAETRQVEIPATFQNVKRQVIDVERLRAQGYRFDDKGDIVATPKGERVLRAAAVGSAKPADSAGAESGEEGYVKEVRVPAEYRTVSRQVVATPAAVRTVEVPATVRTVKRRVVDTPARTDEVVIPATFKTVTRQVVDTPASSREIAVPAQQRTVTRRVVDTPASTRRIPVAAVTQTVERRVIDQPATTREERVPAVYKAETRQVIDQPATVRAIDVPAEYETLTRQVKVDDARTEQRAILCETNATPAKIQQIQRALRQAGFDPGPIDGVIREQTMTAVHRYQQAKRLPVDGYLNLETVKALGVSPL